MNKPKISMQYQQPQDVEVLKMYLNKNTYNRADARKIKRQLRRLRFMQVS